MSSASATPQVNAQDEILKRQAQRKKIRDVVVRTILIFVAVVYALFPVVWVFSVSINPADTNVVTSLIPDNANFDFYNDLLTSDVFSFRSWMWNSLRISFITMVLSVLVSTFSAYAFSRFRFTGRQTTLLAVFLVQVFPSSLLIVAIFLLIQEFGEHLAFLGLNSAGGAILVYLGGALGINT